ncbi:MAG: hypothetical protein ACP5XB_12135 [Isosphaeraceae bacterium]
MSSTKNEPGSPRFKVGDKVRVRAGVIDPDFEDIPLGGWTGTITKVDGEEEPIIYDIKWDQRTLKAMHPVYRNRCERDGLEESSMSLGEEDIEPDDGKQVPIEQPTRIKTPPLSLEDEEDRIRMVFGLTHDDLLPEVNEESLLVYYRYLASKLRFPFNAKTELGGRPLSVSRLIDPGEYDLEAEGLLCEARHRGRSGIVPLAELENASGNKKLVEDYRFWFWNWR